MRNRKLVRDCGDGMEVENHQEQSQISNEHRYSKVSDTMSALQKQL
jgi:hypothetical protein